MTDKKQNKLYAVRYGVDKNGNIITNVIYTSWDECKEVVAGVKDARYKSFLTEGEAKRWLELVAVADYKPSSTDNPANSFANGHKATITHIDEFLSQEAMDEIAFKYANVHREFLTYCNLKNINPLSAMTILEQNFLQQLKELSLYGGL